MWCSAFILHSKVCLDYLLNKCIHMHLHVFVLHVEVEGFCGCLSACDYAEATRILSCHISAQVLEEKKSRPSGWLVVQANPTRTL